MTNLPIYIQFIIIFICQYLFIYFRTKNVEANATKDRIQLFWTGLAVSITWLISVSLGVNAILQGHWILIVATLAGGLLGADHAIINIWKTNPKTKDFGATYRDYILKKTNNPANILQDLPRIYTNKIHDEPKNELIKDLKPKTPKKHKPNIY